jgi:hypothetical protein
MYVRTAAILSVIAALGLITPYANACVEVNSGIGGTEATSHCPFPVNFSWCAGQGCTPMPRAATLLRPGYTLHLTNSPRPVRFYTCRPPTVYDGRDCS